MQYKFLLAGFLIFPLSNITNTSILQITKPVNENNIFNIPGSNHHKKINKKKDFSFWEIGKYCRRCEW